jgi:phage-related protein
VIDRSGQRGGRASGRTRAVYYRDPNGAEPVNAFIDALRPVAAQEAVDDQIDLLNDLPADAPPLAFPHSSRVRGPLRELRCHHGRTLYRILYRRSANLFLLLHAIEKRTETIAETDITIAEKRFRDFRARMDAKRRVPPRAVGRDAPRSRGARS